MKIRAISFFLILCLILSVGAFASGEASGNRSSAEPSAGMTAEEQAWWNAFEIPEGMADIELYPDEQLALREKNYETVCRFMQGLSPYLYLLYTDAADIIGLNPKPHYRGAI